MISISEFFQLLKTGQLLYVKVANIFLFVSISIYIVLEQSDYLYEKLCTKYGFDMVNVARLIFAAIMCLLISLINAFVINKTIKVIISVVLAIIAFVLIKNARNLPIWEEKQ